MEYVYAAMLLHAAKKEINEENVTKVLSAPGVQVNEARVKALIAALEGVNIDEVVSKAAMPVAVTTFVLAERFKLDESYVANVILISTVLSVLTLGMFLVVMPL